MRDQHESARQWLRKQSSFSETPHHFTVDKWRLGKLLADNSALRSRVEELEGALRTIERSALSGYVRNVASRALAKQGAEPVEGGDDGE